MRNHKLYSSAKQTSNSSLSIPDHSSTKSSTMVSPEQVRLTVLKMRYINLNYGRTKVQVNMVELSLV